MRKVQRWCSSCKVQTGHTKISEENIQCGKCGTTRSLKSKRETIIKINKPKLVSFRSKKTTIKFRKESVAKKKILALKLKCKRCHRAYATGFFQEKPYCTACFLHVKKLTKLENLK